MKTILIYVIVKVLNGFFFVSTILGGLSDSEYLKIISEKLLNISLTQT